MNPFTYVLWLLLLAVPQAIFAQSIPPPTNFSGLVDVFISILSTLVILVFSLTFLVFAWGIVKGWIINGGEAQGIQDGKSIVTVGVIALVVMVSLWGILNLLKNSFFG